MPATYRCSIFHLSTFSVWYLYSNLPPYLHFCSQQDTIGFNLAALKYLKRELESKDVRFFADQTQALKEGPKKKRKVVRS